MNSLPTQFSTVFRLVPLFVVTLLVFPSISTAQPSPVDQLNEWLASQDRSRLNDQPWATQALSKAQAARATELLWNDYVAQIKRDRKQEWQDKVIRLDDLQMRFDFKTFGTPDENGRRLFISMHGGGGTTSDVNDQQWKNQIGLYQPEEGIYLAPRAPTDTWNLWHQSHIDQFFERIIQDAVVFEGVDPNRVYIMGYSAGGDGVYQLAPRMADHLAAAAMMAGHPNDASPLGLRNIGFTLHMGGEDSAYDRNKVARQWKEKLAGLNNADPNGYVHEVVIHKGKGHWMDREDAVAVPWMAKFVRDPLPEKIVWEIKGNEPQQYYWLAVQRQRLADRINVRRSEQTITFQNSENADLMIRFNDRMLDLDQPVTIRSEDGGFSITKQMNRTILTLYRTLQERGDLNYVFSAEFPGVAVMD